MTIILALYLLLGHVSNTMIIEWPNDSIQKIKG